MQQSLSISETRKNLPTLVKEVGQHGKFIPITVNGKAQAVLLGYEEFMSILETAKLTVSDAGNIQDHGTVQLLDREDVKVIGEPIPHDAQVEPPHSSHASYESFGGSNDDQNNNQHEEHHEEHHEDQHHDGGEEHHDHNENEHHEEEHHEEEHHDWNNDNGEHHEEHHDDNNNDWNNNGDQSSSDQNHHDY